LKIGVYSRKGNGERMGNIILECLLYIWLEVTEKNQRGRSPQIRRGGKGEEIGKTRENGFIGRRVSKVRMTVRGEGIKLLRIGSNGKLSI